MAIFRLFGIGSATVLACGLLAFAQTAVEETGTAQEDTPQENAGYDAQLAERLGADEYGMKSYVFVTLLTGETQVDDPAESRKLFAGHFANMDRLAKAGQLVLAGPLSDCPPKRGIFILNVATLEEAEKLVKSDPAVAAGVFDYELNKLYSSAALMEIGRIHKSIQKTSIQ
ncbi:MAG: hypothetical protein KDB22_19600 [Planctomycetales bacterium]|nr:hypothetical protein [Planctomycetales bacterium]